MIDTESLRKKVIDLAIQGKLTEQLPSDGDAETLYAQILDHKSQLIKEGKIKKDKALPDIAADEIPFDIPDNWKWVRLRDICKKIVDGDHNPPSGVKEKTEYLMLSAQNISNDRLENLDSARYLTKDVFAEENKRTNLEIGDVLLTIVATLGRSCVYREKYNVCFQRSVCVISTLILPEFLKRFFDSGYIQKLMKDGATGAAQPGFYLNKVEKMCVPLPPLEEQKRIVDKIESTIIEINHIDELQAKYSNDLAVLKSKIIDAGIQGKLTEQLPEDGDAETLRKNALEYKEELAKQGVLKNRKKKNIKSIDEFDPQFQIPSSWRWFRLGEVSEIFGRIGFRGYKRTDLVSKGNGAITMSPSNISKDGNISFDNSTYISWEKYEESPEIMIEKEDIVLVKTGSTYGKSGIVTELPEKATINPQLAVLKYVQCNKKYLLYALQSSVAWSQYESFVVGAATPTFSQENLSNLVLPMPPFCEQERIAKRIDLILEQL